MKPQALPTMKLNNMNIVDPRELKIGVVYMDKDNRKYIYYATDIKNPSKVDVDKKYYFDK